MIINQSNLDALHRVFNAEVLAITDHPGGISGEFTERPPADGTNIEHVVVDITVGLREMIGAKQFGNFRAYSQTLSLRKWECSFGAPIEQINGDKSGVLARAVQRKVAKEGTWLDKIVIDDLTGNPTGYDGVSILNNSHSNVGTGGTTDNLTTNGVGYAELETGTQAITEMFDEAGDPLGLTPTHLIVGTANQELGQQLTGSDKLVGLGDTAEIHAPGAASLDAGTSLLPNYVGGSLGLLVSPRITGNEFFILSRDGRVTPYFAYIFQEFQTTIKDRPEDDNVFHDEEVLFSMTAHITPAPGAWQAWYGSVTA